MHLLFVIGVFMVIIGFSILGDRSRRGKGAGIGLLLIIIGCGLASAMVSAY